MKNNIKGLELYHPYILNLVPYIAIFFIVRLIAGDEWEWGGFWLVIGLMFAWSLFKEITRAIYFHIFIKKQTINNLVSEFEENNFPVPDEFDIDSYGLYLESIANNKDLYPQNLTALILCYELNYGSVSKSFVLSFRFRKLIKKALRIYRQKLKLKGNLTNSHEE